MIRVPKKRKYTPERVEEIRLKLLDWIDNSSVLWLGRFAQENGFHRDRLLEMAEGSEEFGEAFLLAKQAQENWLVLGALGKKLDCGMAAFALKNVAGWRDQRDLEQADDRLDDAFDFVGVPTKEGNGRFKRFMN